MPVSETILKNSELASLKFKPIYIEVGYDCEPGILKTYSKYEIACEPRPFPNIGFDINDFSAITAFI